MSTWQFCNNPILSATDNNYKNAMIISTYHYSALEAKKDDAFFLGLFNTYKTEHIAYDDVYTEWLKQIGSRQGKTLNLNQFMRVLSNSKAKLWDIKIQNIYPQDTPRYKELLPHRRMPFQQGTQVLRLHSVKALIDAIGDDSALAEVKTDVESFFEMLDTALNKQKGSISVTKSMSDEVESARVNMCIAQYSNLGALIKKFAATPEKIEQYFDLQTIRSGHQVNFTGHLKPGEVYNVLKHTFGIDDEIKLINKGDSELRFYLGHNKDSNPGEIYVAVAPHTDQIVPASSLGNLSDTFLMVFNNVRSIEGVFEVVLV